MGMPLGPLRGHTDRRKPKWRRYNCKTPAWVGEAVREAKQVWYDADSIRNESVPTRAQRQAEARRLKQKELEEEIQRDPKLLAAKDTGASSTGKDAEKVPATEEGALQSPAAEDDREVFNGFGDGEIRGDGVQEAVEEEGGVAEGDQEEGGA